MTRRAAAYLLSVVAMLIVPVSAYAQASITGVVRDTSGAVLPGVTVEATSPVLIEKIRTVVSDGGGQYRIVDLRPGLYAVTFTLPGFNTFKRDGIELTGNFTATINAELRVGELQETITVTGEAPVVDVQTLTKTQALSEEVIDAIPTGRNFTNLGVLVPGVSAQCAQACSSGGQDVGGSTGDARTSLIVHGSRFRDQRIAVNGMTISGSTGGLTMTGPNMEAMQEVQLETTSADASTATGGVRINVVPKDGGNRFAGSLFVSGTNEHLQADNFSQELLDRGLNPGGQSRLKKVYDIAPTFGGPIKQDKLWFFLSGRRMNNQTYVGNLFRNKNEGDPTKWTYEPDLSRQVVHDSPLTPVGARLTWQATPRNKFAASLDLRERCDCPNVASSSTSYEAQVDFIFRPDNIQMVQWSSPLTNRLLLEATAVRLPLGWGNRINEGITPGMIRVVEQNPAPGTPSTYRGGAGYLWTNYPFSNVAASSTYVTGAHAFKTGVNWNWGYAHTEWGNLTPITEYRFANGVPNQFTVNSDPREGEVRVGREIGLYAQDKWTIDRLTLSGGLRYDYMYRLTPEIHLGPAPLLPTRNVTFPQTDFTRHHDLSPRVGAAYDLFGNGKTALKAQVNRYVADESLGSGTNVIIGAPHVYFQYAASRAWTDGNRNFIPDCDLANPALQDNRASGGDLCGAFTGPSADFGRAIPGTVDDPDVDFGYGKRGYNWLYSVSVQQELVPQRVAVDVGYYRRTYGNFLVTDNLALSNADFAPFSVTVPNDRRLPNAGETITGFLNVNPNAATRPSQNVVRRTNQYGDQYEYWHGVDAAFNMRLGGGTLVQGGTSTGRTIQDNCEILDDVPEGGITAQQGLNSALMDVTGPLANPFCHQDSGWTTQVKLLGTYTLPRLDVQLAFTFQSVPGPMVAANLVVPNAQVQTSLGRPLSGNAANITVPIVAPGDMYGDRLNQVDFRAGKILRFGPRRVTGSVDLYNMFNSSAVLAESTNYSSFRAPTRVVGGRLVKFTLTTNF